MPKEVLDVDLGIKSIAVDSRGETFSGEKIDKTRARLDALPLTLRRKKVKSIVSKRYISSRFSC